MIFQNVDFSAVRAPGRRAAGAKSYTFDIVFQKKTEQNTIFFTTFFVRLYPVGLIRPSPQIGIGLNTRKPDHRPQKTETFKER